VPDLQAQPCRRHIGADGYRRDRAQRRNLDLARRFGLDGIKGTPTVLIVDDTGKPMNLRDVPKWSNARSRSTDAIYDYFAKEGTQP
jgi:hypothetical protein